LATAAFDNHFEDSGMTEKKAHVIEDSDLDRTIGGIHLIVPAVQKMSEPTTGTCTESATLSPSGTNQLGAGGTRSGDGSV
jgi:hypothetical protein